jgi:hypothetical protein
MKFGIVRVVDNVRCRVNVGGANHSAHGDEKRINYVKENRAAGGSVVATRDAMERKTMSERLGYESEEKQRRAPEFGGNAQPNTFVVSDGFVSY